MENKEPVFKELSVDRLPEVPASKEQCEELDALLVSTTLHALGRSEAVPECHSLAKFKNCRVWPSISELKWELVLDEGDNKVYKGFLPITSNAYFKAVGTLKVPFDDIRTVLTAFEFAEQPGQVFADSECRRLRRIDANRTLISLVMSLNTTFVSDRAFTYYVHRCDHVKDCFILSSKSVSHAVPRASLVEGNIIHSGCIVERVEGKEGFCRISSLSMTDPAGWIPTTLVNMTAKHQVSLTNIFRKGEKLKIPQLREARDKAEKNAAQSDNN